MPQLPDNQPDTESRWDEKDLMPPLKSADTSPVRHGSFHAARREAVPDAPRGTMSGSKAPDSPPAPSSEATETHVDGKQSGKTAGSAEGEASASARTPPVQRSRVENAALAREAVAVVTTVSMKLRQGQVPAARKDIEAFLEAHTDVAAAHEAHGDVAMAEGRLGMAASAYRKALDLEPGRPTAEMKLARVALRHDEGARRASMGVAYAGADASVLEGSAQGSKGKMWFAVLASLVLPGLGQIINGEYVKGGIVLVVWIAATFKLLSLPDIGSLNRHVSQDMAVATGHSTALPTIPSFGPLFWVLLAASFGLLVFSVADAAVRGTRGRGTPR
ncbi:MAG: hypothetical protein ACLQVD_11830 [Capsulimonadaceae bacterium]